MTSRSTERSTELARLAGLLADDTRAAFCLALIDGRAWTPSELAAHAGVAASTATEHLNRLLAGGLLIERRQGRHRYVQLADERTAELIENMTTHLEPRPAEPKNLRSATITRALARGRTCYDHLAGRLGVVLTDAMRDAGLLTADTGFALTDAGLRWLTTDLAADPEDLRASRRPLVRPCLDWTERRTHLAGYVGAHLCRVLHERDWVRQVGTSRARRVTDTGRTALHSLLALDPATLDAP